MSGSFFDTIGNVATSLFDQTPEGAALSGQPIGTVLGDAAKGLGESALSFGGAEGLGPISDALGGVAGGASGGAGPGIADAAGGAGLAPSAGIGGGSAVAGADPFGTGPAFLGGDVSLGADATGGTGAIGGATGSAPSLDPSISGLVSGNDLGPSQGALSSEPPTAASPSAQGPGLGPAPAPVDPTGGTTAGASAGNPLDPNAASGVTAGPAPAGGYTPAVLNSSGLPGATAGVGGADPSGLFGANGPLSGVKSFLKDNKDLLGLGGLGLSLGKQALFPSQIPGQQTLASNAGLAQNIAQQFGGGGLNPAQSAASTQTLNQQISAIKAKYASLGLSGSTAEQQDINNAQNANLANQASTINQNAGTALSALGVSNAPTQAIAEQQLQDDQQLSDSIALLAAAGLYGKS